MITDFSFDGTTLSEMGYMLCDFSGNTEETLEVSVMDYTDIKAPLSDKSHKVATSYPNNYSRTLQVCKMDCNNPDTDLILTDEDISAMARWLCKKEYKWFNWDKEEYYTTIQGEKVLDTNKVVYYKAHCKMSKIVFGGECHGLEITIETNAPYGFTKQYSVTNTGSSLTIDLRNICDEVGYIYPIQVSMYSQNSSGTYGLRNTSDNNRMTSITNCTAGDNIYILCDDVQQIYTDSLAHYNFYRDFNYIFPRLLTTTPNNYVITLNGTPTSDISVQFDYRCIRKVGL